MTPLQSSAIRRLRYAYLRWRVRYLVRETVTIGISYRFWKAGVKPDRQYELLKEIGKT